MYVHTFFSYFQKPPRQWTKGNFRHHFGKYLNKTSTVAITDRQAPRPLCPSRPHTRTFTQIPFNRPRPYNWPPITVIIRRLVVTWTTDQPPIPIIAIRGYTNRPLRRVVIGLPRMPVLVKSKANGRLPANTKPQLPWLPPKGPPASTTRPQRVIFHIITELRPLLIITPIYQLVST